MDHFSNLRGLWAYSWNLQREKSAREIADTLVWFVGPSVALHQKCLEGLTWQGEFDLAAQQRGEFPPGPTAPRSFADADALRDGLAAHGVGFVPVTLARGLAGEAQAHGALFRRYGCGVVDIEWDGSGDYWTAPPEMIEVYARELREAAGDAFIGWQPDARIIDPGREGELRFLVTAALPFIDALLPQVYAGWPAYGLGDGAIARDGGRLERFAALGRPVYPTLYLSESLAEPERLWDEARRRVGAAGFVAFRFGAMDGNALGLTGRLPLPVKLIEVDLRARYIEALRRIVAEADEDLARITARRERALQELRALEAGGGLEEGRAPDSARRPRERPWWEGPGTP
jgi:hypothetical protein